MLDRDLAPLYGVRPIALRQQVKRNRAKFSVDFMFQLTLDEANLLVSQSVIPSRRSFGGSLPYAFTQEGVAMLSGVLRSKRAINVNIEIMRAFVRLRRMLTDNAELAKKLLVLEAKYDDHFRIVFHAIRELMAESSESEKGKIGFRFDTK